MKDQSEIYVINDKKNDLDSVSALFRRFYKPLRAYAFRFLNDWNISEDIVQDVFYDLWIRRSSIRFDQTSVSSYLFRAVYTRSINYLNECSQKCTHLDNKTENNILDRYLNQYMQNQEDSLLLRELEQTITKFISTLPPQCQKIFVLSRKYHLKNREIADQLQISVKAVEKQITKALAELRLHLTEKELLIIILLYNL